MILKIFRNEELGSVRTVSINEELYFVGKDVAEILGYRETANMRKLIEKEDYIEIDPQSTLFTRFVQNGTVLEPNKNVRRMLLINESGLYTAMFNSTLPNAKRFKHWVTSEVLPSICRNGAYAIDELIANPDMLIQALMRLKQERTEKQDFCAGNSKQISETKSEF